MSTAGKTIVLTGASSGIGAAAARQLHAAGATVVPVGRDARKTAAIAEELGTSPLTVDYSDLDQVRKLAAELAERCPRIDVLANNAGGQWTTRQTTRDGYELTLQVNCLSPFLLTRLLADKLRESGGRAIFTSTFAAHKKWDFDLSDLDSERSYKSHNVYSLSKLATAVLAREFSRRNPGIGIADFHPGMVASDFARDQKFQQFLINSPLRKPLQSLLSTPEQGAATLVHLCGTTEPLDGAYYVKGKRQAESENAKNPELGGRLWDIASARVGLLP